VITCPMLEKDFLHTIHDPTVRDARWIASGRSMATRSSVSLGRPAPIIVLQPAGRTFVQGCCQGTLKQTEWMFR
jgi:hypothetical protein